MYAASLYPARRSFGSRLGAPRDAAEKFDLIFIDGSHRFDDVLVDFTLAAELCPIGGSIVFDDAFMKSIWTVILQLPALGFPAL